MILLLAEEFGFVQAIRRTGTADYAAACRWEQEAFWAMNASRLISFRRPCGYGPRELASLGWLMMKAVKGVSHRGDPAASEFFYRAIRPKHATRP
jgi:hypothetical protein